MSLSVATKLPVHFAIDRVRFSEQPEARFTMANHAYCEGYVDINSVNHHFSCHMYNTGNKWVSASVALPTGNHPKCRDTHLSRGIGVDVTLNAIEKANNIIPIMLGDSLRNFCATDEGLEARKEAQIKHDEHELKSTRAEMDELEDELDQLQDKINKLTESLERAADSILPDHHS